MKIIFLLIFVAFTIITFTSLQTITAQTYSNPQKLQEMFNPVNNQSNTYNDPTHNFSISPPDGWVVKSQSNVTNQALVTFSNQNPQSLANFGIYYGHLKPIPQTIIALPDDIILNHTVTDLFDTSQFTVLQKNIQRFSDGFIVQAISEPKINSQLTPINEWLLFWLDDGRQYLLLLTSSQNNFNQNQADFDRAATTFYVGS